MSEKTKKSWALGEAIKTWDEPAKPGKIPPFNLAEPIARHLKSTLGKYDTDKPPGSVTLPLSFHHAIPWFTLKGFWSELFKRRHFEVFKEFLALSGCPKAGFADLSAKVDSGQFLSEREVPGKPGWSLAWISTDRN